MAEVASATEIKSVDRLKEISKDIPQVEEFRKYTDDFKNLEKLKPEEILYLNLCDWLEPQAAKINDALMKRGGIKVIDPVTKVEVVIEKFDLVHSLLGEMKPEALANRTSGGHLYIPELRAATLDIGKIESFGNGFLDMEIKYAGKIGNTYKKNSYFPAGTTVEQSVTIIEDAILNFKEAPNIKILSDTKSSLNITNKLDQSFTLYVEKGVAKYHPLNPKARYK